MNKIILILIVLILPEFILAQKLNITHVEDKHIALPSQVHSLVFRIQNPYAYPLDLKTNLTLPKNWQIISHPQNITLKPEENKIVIIPVFIPANASPGNHEAELHVMSDSLKITESKGITIAVKEHRKIVVKTLSPDTYIKAGDTIKSTFLIKNEGNFHEKIRLNTDEENQIEGLKNFELQAGETREVELIHITKANLDRPTQKSITLIVDYNNILTESLYGYHRVDVIPIVHKDFDIYHRFPIKLAGTYIAHQVGNRYKNTFQGEIQGLGYLDKNHIHRLEFQAIGPDNFGNMPFSQQEQYNINYSNKSLYIHLGDKGFSSSYLTEFSRYGRGIEIIKKINSMEFSGFYVKPRFHPDIDKEVNFAAKYRIKEFSSIALGYLLKQNQKNQQEHLQYITANTEIFKHLHLESELAISQNEDNNGYAWRLQGISIYKKLTASLSYLKSSRDFSGYFSNSQYLNGYINYEWSRKINLHSSYQKDARNLQLDTLYGQAPYREFIQIGSTYKYTQNGMISLFAGNQSYEDRMQIKMFNYVEQFARISLQQTIRNFTLNIQSQWAKTQNHLANFKGNSSDQTLDISYNKNKTHIGIFGSYTNASRYEIRNQKLFYYGGRFSTELSQKLKLSTNFQNTFALEQYYADRNLFELVLNYDVTSRHSINLTSRYSLARKNLEDRYFSILLNLKFNLNVPLKKIMNYGTLKGNIKNFGYTKTENIKVNLGNQTAIVDESGNFIFKNLNPNPYYLEFTKGSLHPNDITSVKTPAMIQIKEGDNTFDIEINKSVSLLGTIKLDDEINGDNESIIVEITSENEVFRKICELNKPFNFIHLRPGIWQVKVYRNGLNKAYKITKDSFILHLNPGDEQEIIIPITKEKNEIRFLQDVLKVGKIESNT